MDLTEVYVVCKIAVETEEIALLIDLLINRRVKTWLETIKMKLKKNIDWSVVSKRNM